MEKTETTNSAFASTLIIRPQTPEPACSVDLTERDAVAVIAAAENPPAPNEAALQAARRFVGRHG
jgi:hypothetical protein